MLKLTKKLQAGGNSVYQKWPDVFKQSTIAWNPLSLNTPDFDGILINKKNKTLTYLGDTYNIMYSKIGSAPKTKEGDNLSPEGIFTGTLEKYKNNYYDKEYGERPYAYGNLGLVLRLKGTGDNGFDISNCGILIHGLDDVGKKVGTHGCFGLDNKDLKNLFSKIKGPVKVKVIAGKLGTKLALKKKFNDGGLVPGLLTLSDIPIPTIDVTPKYTNYNLQPILLQAPSQSLINTTLTPPFSGNVPEAIKKVLNVASQGKFYSTSTKRYESLGQDKYKHKCTSGPATFYKDALGIKLNGLWWDTGSPKTATKTNITLAGFTEKWSGDGEDVRNGNWKNVVRPGDIMVMFSSKSGHAEMWDGSKWVSDTNQSKAWCYGKDNGRAGKRSAIIYRNDSLWV